MLLVHFLVVSAFYDVAATGAHQHVVAFPLEGHNNALDPIWIMLADKLGIGPMLPTVGLRTIVARSTASQYNYELWLCTAYGEDIDPEFFGLYLLRTANGAMSALSCSWLFSSTSACPVENGLRRTCTITDSKTKNTMEERLSVFAHGQILSLCGASVLCA